MSVDFILCNLSTHLIGFCAFSHDKLISTARQHTTNSLTRSLPFASHVIISPPRWKWHAIFLHWQLCCLRHDLNNFHKLSKWSDKGRRKSLQYVNVRMCRPSNLKLATKIDINDETTIKMFFPVHCIVEDDIDILMFPCIIYQWVVINNNYTSYARSYWDL